MSDYIEFKSNSSFDLEAYILSQIAVNSSTDKLSLYLIMPMAILGVVFNFISFGIFCKKKFNKVSLFKFMQMYTFASAFGSSCLIFYFYMAPYTFPEFILNFGTRIYNCKVLIGILNMYAYENALDSFINIERAVCFSTGFKRYKKISPYTIGSIVFFVCLLISGPLYFTYHILSDTDLHDRQKNTQLANRYLNLCELSEFTLSGLGKIFLIISFLMTGPVIFVMDAVTNLIAFISYRRFMERKKEALRQPQHNNKSKKQMKKEAEDRRLFLMTCLLSIYSCVNHLVQFASEFVTFIVAPPPKIVAWYIWITFLTISLKKVVNIFFFIGFNKRFRHALFFWRSKTTSKTQ
jgi:hypothetical protein